MTMTFMAGKFNDEKGYWDTVFTDTEMKNGDWIAEDEDDLDAEFVPNPDYRPEFDINMANARAEVVIEALGYKVEGGCFHAPLDEFMARCEQWLKDNIGRRHEGQPVTVDAAPGRMTMVDCGMREGYVNEAVHDLRVMASEAKQRGAVRVWAG